MNEPVLQTSAEVTGDTGLWDKAPAWRSLIVLASFLTLAAVATPLLLPKPVDKGFSTQVPPAVEQHAITPSVDLANLPIGTEIVPSGVLTKVNRHNRYTQRLGGDLPISITLISPPAHGTISTKGGTALLTFPNAGVTRVSSVTNVFYQSAPGYVGQDSFTYRRTSPDPNDPLNARTYTVTIYVK